MQLTQRTARVESAATYTPRECIVAGVAPGLQNLRSGTDEGDVARAKQRAGIGGKWCCVPPTRAARPDRGEPNPDRFVAARVARLGGLTEAELMHGYGGRRTDLSALLAEAGSIVALAAVSAGAILRTFDLGPWGCA